MNSIMKKRWLAGALCSLGLLTACGGGGGSYGSSTPPPAQMGTLKVGLTDAPSCGFDQVNVTVAKVRVNQSSAASDTDAGWTDITLSPARKINLLALSNGALDALGQAPLTAGHYSQLRLVLSANSSASPMSNSVVPTGGHETAIDTPSATQSGIKLTHEFDVAAGAVVDLTLDFDACKSIVSRGNGSYLLKPVVNVVPMVISGSIAGFVDPAVVSSHAVVSAQQNGVVVKSTVPDATGAFSLSPVTAGSYTVVVTADGRASDVVSGVPVTAAATTTLSTTASPILMAMSTSNTVSGVVLPFTAEAGLTVTQTVATGQTVVIGSQAAVTATGAYSFNLPVAPPMLGAYGTLPVVLTAQTAAAGKYQLAAAATGFTAQKVDIDNSAAAVVKNFTLLP
jgi:hypothetical protein